MAAYCGCCGAEITLKAEACPVCGTPRHGMMPENQPMRSCLTEEAFPQEPKPERPTEAPYLNEKRSNPEPRR